MGELWPTTDITGLCPQLTVGSGPAKRRWAPTLRSRSCETVMMIVRKVYVCYEWITLLWCRAMRHFQSLDYRAATVDDDDSLLDTVHQNTITYVHLCRRASEHYHVCSLVSLCIRTLSSMFTSVSVLLFWPYTYTYMGHSDVSTNWTWRRPKLFISFLTPPCRLPLLLVCGKWSSDCSSKC